VTTAHQAGTYISVAIGGAIDYGFLNLLTAVGSNASDASFSPVCSGASSARKQFPALCAELIFGGKWD
jgi:hypothetical protein